MKPVAQRTEMPLLPRPAWDKSEASDGDNEDECSQYNPAASSERSRTTVNRTASGLAGQHVPAHPSSSSSLPVQATPPHGTLGSKAAIIVVKIHYPLLSRSHLQTTAVTSQEQLHHWDESITKSQYHYWE